MSRRTKLKVRNMRLFLTKNVFNSRYIVRNILAFTIMITVIAMCAGAVIVIGDKKEAKAETAIASGNVEEVVILDGSMASMNASGTNMIRADLESVMTADKEAKEKEVVAAAVAAEFTDKCAANRDDVNVRAEASTDSAIVGHMNIGACGDVLAQADGWVQITSGDVKGYVKADYVTVGEEAYALAKKYYSMTAVAKEDGINLRAAASKDAEVVGAVYENVTYTVTPEKTDDAWVCLQVATGAEGYASADYMEVTEGYRVAEPVDEVEAENDATSEDTASTTEEKKATGSVEENKQTTQTTTEKPSTTQQTTTEATTQANNSSTIGSSSRTPVSLSDADINLMAAVMTLECGSESYEGQLAVANVILNRLQSGAWGNTISSVVYAANQFSVVSDSRLQGLIQNGAQASCIQAARDACAGNNNIGDLMSFRPARNVDTSTLGTYKQIGNHVFF
ncbi:cell wall hydrolase [Eubacterium sp. MSJ-21]|nr:cell wall hydrolase [Eubacterium sp. MSJ-21]